MTLTAEQVKTSLTLLEIPINSDTLSRCARAKDLLDRESIHFLRLIGEDRVYRVDSQTGSDSYTVQLNGVKHDCTCPDAERSDFCKHQIACKMVEFKGDNSKIAEYKAAQKERREALDELNASIEGAKQAAEQLLALIDNSGSEYTDNAGRRWVNTSTPEYADEQHADDIFGKLEDLEDDVRECDFSFLEGSDAS